MITGIDHIGIAVKNLDEMVTFYTEKLGLELKGIEEVAEQKVRSAIIMAGDVKIELLETTSPESPIARHIEARGEGLQHLAFKVTDIEGEIAEVSKKGVALIDKVPRTGVGGSKIAFLHPKGSKALIEFCEHG